MFLIKAPAQVDADAVIAALVAALSARSTGSRFSRGQLVKFLPWSGATHRKYRDGEDHELHDDCAASGMPGIVLGCAPDEPGTHFVLTFDLKGDLTTLAIDADHLEAWASRDAASAEEPSA